MKATILIIQVLLFCFAFSLVDVSAQQDVKKDIQKEKIKKEKKATGEFQKKSALKLKHQGQDEVKGARYLFYPKAKVYYDKQEERYICMENDEWVEYESLPERLQGDALKDESPVSVDYDGDAPQLR